MAGYPNIKSYGKGVWNGIFTPSAQAIYDGQGDKSACKYYDEMAKKNEKCDYNAKATLICRGENGWVNAAIETALKVELVSQGKSLKQSEVLTSIRTNLVASDNTAQAAGKKNENGCTKENDINAYHSNAFSESGIGAQFYGGNLWPQGIYPNPLPREK